MSTQAVGTAEDGGVALTVVRYLDLIVLALALVLFVALGLPLIGYAAAAAAWLAQRSIHGLASRRARQSQDPRTVVGLLAGSMLGRGWLVAGSILAVGLLAGNQDGLAAAVLSISLFTIYFSTQMVVRPFDMPEAKR